MLSKTEFQVSLHSLPVDEKTNPCLAAKNRMITDTGIDRATFLIAPNIGETLKPLASIASGGELSRVVLALKALLAKTDSVETVVFDEVDAGIGGGVAEVVGKKLADLANHPPAPDRQIRRPPLSYFETCFARQNPHINSPAK